MKTQFKSAFTVLSASLQISLCSRGRAQISEMRVNVARVWEDADYEKVRVLCENHDDWVEVYNKKDIRVFTQNIENSNYQMIKASAFFPDVPASVAYDVLHDSAYRSHWDKYMIKQESIGLINPNNDVCYYSLNSFPPIRPRDFVMQRSWLETDNDRLICSHSICHEDYPPAKGCIRATVLLSGYLIKPKESGCEVIYISHSDPKGKLPTWLVNRVTKVVAPKVIKKLHKACIGYAVWKEKHHPSWKPWSVPEQQMDFPRVDLLKCQPKDYEQEIIDESNLSAVSISTKDDDEDSLKN
uniref:START domain-containing protein 10 n=1 Tax=Caenorhabditis japonica TaxID=281687 RepID=A0A8R1DPY4_CAEJA